MADSYQHLCPPAGRSPTTTAPHRRPLALVRRGEPEDGEDAAARFSAYLSTPATENLTVRDRSVTDPYSGDVSLDEGRSPNRVQNLAPEHGFEP
jgi:hypothetical protein